MKKQNNILVFIIILLTFSIIPLVNAQAPYTISVEPETDTASPGELKDYTITITTDPGYDEPVYIELNIVALTYNETYYIGTANPPYPTELSYSFPVPEEVPGDVTAHGTITGMSGDYEVETQVTLHIKSGGILGSIIGWVLSILNTLRNLFS